MQQNNDLNFEPQDVNIVNPKQVGSSNCYWYRERNGVV